MLKAAKKRTFRRKGGKSFKRVGTAVPADRRKFMPEHENRTRRELNGALRALLRQKPLDQLRVRELTEQCGLRRQSFYYHFKDVYDLFAWSVRQERTLLLDRLADCLTWRQALIELLDRAGEERAFYRAVLDWGGRAALGEMIPLEEMLETLQAYYRDRCGVPPDRAAEERDLRCERDLLLSLLESWVRGGTALGAEELADALERAVEQRIAGAVWQTLWKQGEWSPLT